jgi:hypothetical protein
MTLAMTVEKLVGENTNAQRPAATSAPGPFLDTATLQSLLPADAVQALLVVQWFAREAAELPPSARIEALKCACISGGAYAVMLAQMQVCWRKCNSGFAKCNWCRKCCSGIAKCKFVGANAILVSQKSNCCPPSRENNRESNFMRGEDNSERTL